MEKKFHLSGVVPLALGACLLTTLISCGDSSSDSNSGNAPQEQTQEGLYQADLSPENASVSSAKGSAEITLVGDDFNVVVTMVDAQSTIHAQHIHAGTRCPTATDDINGDGLIDAVEAEVVYGPAILPLDDDLVSNSGTFPSGAIYTYIENASFAQILANLNLQTLNVEGLVVNIHGVAASTTLPSTVQGTKDEFPVSYGIIKKVIIGRTTNLEFN
jgi:hypothetical protein